MSTLAHRAYALLLVLVLAVTGALPCSCSEMSAAAPGRDHCDEAADERRSESDACTCTCMTAPDAQAAATRAATVDAHTVSLLAAASSAIAGRSASAAMVAPPRPGRPRPVAPPLILRI